MAITSKWRQHIDAWQSSGLSQQDYCEQQLINFRTFTARLSVYRKLPAVASAGLITIHIESTGVDVIVLKHARGVVAMFCLIGYPAQIWLAVEPVVMRRSLDS